MKKRLLISFSGGRTSAFMMWWLLNVWELRNEFEIIVVFANTGKEREETLQFVYRCQVEWNINIIWVEATHKDENGKPHTKKGWQVKHRIVSYFTASRKGEPFEEMISILGIPSENAPFCSPQLKRQAILAYCKSIGWEKLTYNIAIGLRYDEKSRMDAKFNKKKIIYPLIQLVPTYKRKIIDWFKGKEFDLTVDPDLGNCDECWKKDLKRLARNTRNYPETFNWWEQMVIKYGHLNPRKTDLKPPFNFYRGNMAVKDIFKLAKLEDTQIDLFAYKEKIPRCGERCEAF